MLLLDPWKGHELQVVVSLEKAGTAHIGNIPLKLTQKAMELLVFAVTRLSLQKPLTLEEVILALWPHNRPLGLDRKIHKILREINAEITRVGLMTWDASIKPFKSLNALKFYDHIHGIPHLHLRRGKRVLFHCPEIDTYQKTVSFLYQHAQAPGVQNRDQSPKWLRGAAESLPAPNTLLAAYPAWRGQVVGKIVPTMEDYWRLQVTIFTQSIIGKEIADTQHRVWLSSIENEDLTFLE